MVWTSLGIRAGISLIRSQCREKWWPAPSQARVWDQLQESSDLSPGVPGSSAVCALNAGLWGTWEEGLCTGDLAGSLSVKVWGPEEHRIRELRSAVYQVTLIRERRLPVLFLLLGYSKDLGCLWSPLCRIFGSQWSTGRAGHLAAYGEVQIYKSGFIRLSFCSMNALHLDAQIPKKAPN